MILFHAEFMVYPSNTFKVHDKKVFFSKDVGFKVLKLAKMPIVHLGWLKKYFSGNTGHSD